MQNKLTSFFPLKKTLLKNLVFTKLSIIEEGPMLYNRFKNIKNRTYEKICRKFKPYIRNPPKKEEIIFSYKQTNEEALEFLESALKEKLSKMNLEKKNQDELLSDIISNVESDTAFTHENFSIILITNEILEEELRSSDFSSTQIHYRHFGVGFRKGCKRTRRLKKKFASHSE